MKLAIFTQIPRSYTSRRLVEEAKKAAIEVQIIDYRQLDFDLQGKKVRLLVNGLPLSWPDRIILGSAGEKFSSYRDLLVAFFRDQHLPVLNAQSLMTYPQLDSKIFQHFLFLKNDLPCVPTWIFGDERRLKGFNQPYPWIMKNRFGSKGKQVFKVSSLAEATKVLTDFVSPALLIQPFLPAGEDLRIIVLDREIVGGMKRLARPGAYLTNYSAGGVVEKYDLTQDIVASELALTAARIALIDYGGVDLMRNQTGQWQVLEINRPCQFEGFEKATGINAARKIIKYLISQ